MKKMMRLSVLCAAGILFSQTAFAADEKIGFVDLGKLMQESTAYQGFMMQREKEFKSVSASLDKEQKALAEKERKIAEDGNDSSKAELGKKLDKLDKEKKEFGAKIANAELKLREYTEQGLKKIQDEAITPVMASLAKEHDFDAILNVNTALYVSDKVNVTEEAVKQINEKLPKLDFPKIKLSDAKKPAKKKK
ncbi:outer membrane chaperone Skp (OmpH) [Acetobacter sp. CAG:977]|nr:outer membrane chaperone Skp (OmpH) [Acetobacter sp. CAG:977]